MTNNTSALSLKKASKCFTFYCLTFGYKLKPVFGVSWISGLHGWFEKNTNRLHYHIDKNLFTINEDL